MATVPGGSTELIKNELEKRFHLIAHRETRITNVLLLRVRNPNAPGIKPHDPREGYSMSNGNHSTKIRGLPLNGFIGNIESRLGLPVLDETDLKGRYDLQLQWGPGPGETDKDAFVRALRDQLGLELIPTNMPVEMLVVEKER